MAIKVLALESGVTGLADHRVLNGAMMTSAGFMQVRGGVLRGAGGGDLSTVSAMVARVAPVKVLIPNTISSALGPYLLVSDANVDITFDAGEAAVPRVDRIIARAYDDVNDASGQTVGSIYYLKGQAGGNATSLPANSVLLYEMSIPAGASAGGGGVNFANAVDQRIYTVAAGGMFTVANNTQMAAIGSPFEGMTCYRTDLDVQYIYDGTTWRARGVANVASSANLTNINNPYDGLIAVTRDTDAIYVYNGSTWVAPKAYDIPIGKLAAQSTQTLADNTQVAIQFGTSSEEIDTHNFHNESTNNTRVTPTVAGYYRFTGTVWVDDLTTPVTLDVSIRKNGSTNLVPGQRSDAPAFSHSLMTSTIVSMNGSTDYVELMGRQNSAGSDNTAAGFQFTSCLDWEFIRPLTY